MNASAYAALSARARPCGGKEFGTFAKNEGSQDGWNAVSEGRVTPGLDDEGLVALIRRLSQGHRGDF